MSVPCARTEPKQNSGREREGNGDEFVLLLVLFLVTCKTDTGFSVYSATGILIKENGNVQYIWKALSGKD